MESNTTQRQPEASLEKRVATNVRAALAARRYTSSDLAKELHITQRAAQRRLNGQTPFSLSEAGVVAGWLGITYSALVAPTAFESHEVAA